MVIEGSSKTDISSGLWLRGCDWVAGLLALMN
jgi:hypothetical protein